MIPESASHWVISTIIITLNTLYLPRNMSISARRSLWNVQIVVARSLLKRRYSVWQCGGTPVFVRGSISIVSLLTLFPGRRSAEMPVKRIKKEKKKRKKMGGGGGVGVPDIHASGWLFLTVDSRLLTWPLFSYFHLLVTTLVTFTQT